MAQRQSREITFQEFRKWQLAEIGGKPCRHPGDGVAKLPCFPPSDTLAFLYVVIGADVCPKDLKGNRLKFGRRLVVTGTAPL